MEIQLQTQPQHNVDFKMKVSDLKVGQGKVDITLEVKSKSPARSFEKFGKQLRVCNAEAVDSTGDKITLSLWNDDVDKVNVGDSVIITNGYVSEFNGQKQLGTGKFGKLEIAGKESDGDMEKKSSDQKPAKKEKADEEESNEDVDEMEF